MSEIKVDTVAEKTSANGVTVDGLNIKDSKLVTANSVVAGNITDGAVTAAKLASGVGGKILQVLGASTATEATQASTSYASSGLTLAITPSATSSKILVLVGSNVRVAGDGGASNSARQALISIFRGSVSGTKLQEQLFGNHNISDSTSAGVQSAHSISFAFLDSPNTTNATTYTVGISGSNNGDAQAQPFNTGSAMTLLEIGA